MNEKVKKAVIPAAGLGTRFLPATKAIPKEMLPIVDTPTIQYIVEEAIASGIEEILIITGRGKEAIENHFDFNPELDSELEKKNQQEFLNISKSVATMANIHYVRQKQPKGLGHAVGCAKAFVGREPFAVLLGDDIVHSPQIPCLGQMISVYERYGASVLGVQTVKPDAVSKYGIVDGALLESRVYEVRGLVEKPRPQDAPSNVAILGRYILTPEIFDILERTKPGVGGEIQLTDALSELSRIQKMYAYDFIGRRYDVGMKQGLIEASIEYGLRRPELRDSLLAYLKYIVESAE